MQRDLSLLQVLKDKMQQWLAFIGKSTYATSVKILPGENGEFVVYVIWDKPFPGEYRKIFTRPIVFGRSMQLTSAAWSVQKCVADFARDVVREVLQARGVL